LAQKERPPCAAVSPNLKSSALIGGGLSLPFPARPGGLSFFLRRMVHMTQRRCMRATKAARFGPKGDIDATRLFVG
jgi:hypothetical protein